MLKVQNLSCGYGNHLVLKNVSFSAKAGEKICILGANGCGKTTLLRAISGMIPFDGTVALSGQNLQNMSRTQVAKKMAVMTQASQIYFSYTIYETVMMGRYAHRSKGLFSERESKQDKEIVKQCLQDVGLFELKDRLITQLSGGQLQRVFLARTFAQTPDIILLDEPTNHLDLKYQIELSELLTQWTKQQNRCVVGVLHDINLALSFADSVVLMKEGEIVCHQPVNQLDLSQLEQVYDTNVSQYMRESLKRWERND